MASVRTFTAIGRPVDPRYPTNLAILVIAAAVFVAGWLYQVVSGASVAFGFSWGGGAALSVFITWALARELDPDHPYAAFVAAAFALGASLAYAVPPVLFGFWALLALRVINRTCGRPVTWFDSVLTAAVALLLVRQGLWVVGLGMTAAFVADAVMVPASRRQFVVAAAALAGTFALVGLPTFAGLPALHAATWVAVALAGALMVGVLAASRDVRSVGDWTKTRLVAARVQAAQSLALVVAATALAAHGDSGFVAALPVWAGMLGVGTYRVVTIAFPGARTA